MCDPISDRPKYCQRNFLGSNLEFTHCSSNININDVLGDYALTLVDSLDTLAVSTTLHKLALLSNVSEQNLKMEMYRGKKEAV